MRPNSLLASVPIHPILNRAARHALGAVSSVAGPSRLAPPRAFTSGRVRLSESDGDDELPSSDSNKPSPSTSDKFFSLETTLGEGAKESEPDNPFDDLFSGPDPFPKAEPMALGGTWVSESERRGRKTVPRSVLFAPDSKSATYSRDVARTQQQRKRYDRSPLTPIEVADFASLLTQVTKSSDAGKGSTGATAREDDSRPFGAYTSMIGHASARERSQALLAAYAARNRIRPTAESGRRKVLREGLAAAIPQAQLDAGIDQAREDLAMCENEQDVWTWARREVWGLDQSEGHAPKFGRTTPFYAPVVHMLFLTLRDRYRSPQAALAVPRVTRSLGIESYVLGCTAPLYVEVLKTCWDWLGDLTACRDAVRAARETGVLADPKSRRRELRGTKLSAPAEDEAIRETVDRIKSEVRANTLAAIAARSEEYSTAFLYKDNIDELGKPDFAQQNALALAHEMGRLAGPPSRLMIEAMSSPRRPRTRHERR